MSQNKVKQCLNVPTEFEFPFKPYDIQIEFMKNLYQTLEEGKLGIFESPTGTGKSLSIICGVLKWLKDHEKRERSEFEESINSLRNEKQVISTEGDDWLSSQSKEIEITKKINSLQLELNKININDEKIAKLKSRKRDLNAQKTKILIEKSEKIENIEKNEPDEQNIDDIDLIVEDDLGNDLENEDYLKDDEEEKYEGTKIYICSRTHSQLAQLVHEVERSSFGEDIRLISLASRQNYCINPQVNKFNNSTLINEKCLELQKSKIKSTAKDIEGKILKKKQTNCQCMYLQMKSVQELSEMALLQVQDVEQLTTIGKKINACPYYGARAAIKDSQVVILPYNMILHKSTREASGIKLKNNIVIIDEAHNLLEALTDMHSAQVSGHQLLHSHSQLSEYRNKYRSRFSASNLLSINQLIYIIGKLINSLGGKPSGNSTENVKEGSTKLLSVVDFVTSADIDNYNIYKLIQFCMNTKLCQKLNGFATKYQSTVNINEKKQEKGVSAFLKEISKNKIEEVIPLEKQVPLEEVPKNPMLPVMGFLEALTNKCEDGRIVCCKQGTVGKSFLKFLLLNPSSCFTDIVKEARSIVVAGGTMQPISEFKNRLFISSGAPEERISQFSCDHIVSSENILPLVLSSGPTGYGLDFTYEFRNSSNTIDELGRILQNVCAIVPSGIVCFFPSYAYEQLVYSHLEKNKTLRQISLKKQIFREPKSSSDVDKVLMQYAKAIKFCGEGKTGALLFSVVGGKLSEGLNFSDDLGRCVIVVGMPYPNITSPELVEKMSYLNKTELNQSAGNIYYENLCIKAVNQCIGRAIRHQNDYACILLLDKRYSRPKTQQALPSWILRSLVTCDQFKSAFSGISKFFNKRKSNLPK